MVNISCEGKKNISTQDFLVKYPVPRENNVFVTLVARVLRNNSTPRRGCCVLSEVLGSALHCISVSWAVVILTDDL